MADVKKTVDIEVKADMKQLLNEFKKMPGMTAKEAKKMVSTLGKNYKAAEQAAKKTAAANKRAMDKIARANQRAAKSARNVRMQSREMGAAFGSLEDVIGELNPELAGMATVIGTVGQGFRSLSRSLATGNPLVLGLIAGIAALAAGYTVLTAATRAAEQRQKDMAKATELLNKKLKTQRNIANEVVSAHRNATMELEVFTGQMSELDASIIQARDSAGDQLTKQLESQDEIIKNQEKNIELVNKAKRAYSSLTDEETQQLKLLTHSSKIREVNVGLGTSLSGRGSQLTLLQGELNKQLLREQGFRTKIVTTNKETLDSRISLLKLQNELKKEQEAESRREEQRTKEEASRKAKQAKIDSEKRTKEAEEKAKAAKEEQRLEKLTIDIQKTGESSRKKSAEINLQNRRTNISLLKEEIQRVTENAKLDQEIIQDRIDNLEKQKLQNIALAETEEQKREAKEANLELDKHIDELKEQSHLREMTFSKEREKALEREKKKRLELIGTIINQSAEGANAVAEIIKNVSGENKKAAMIAFRVNQAAAIANIAMTTAQKVMEVAPNPFAIAGVTALGAIQAGVVATQPAPEFHMGGVVDKGEDTRNITVLSGEAVLDRRTVRNLGGEQGISQLQRGKIPTPSKVVVLNPFKHFDRYASASAKRGGIMNQFSNNKASGVY